MSHLSILPTVLRDEQLLASSLESLGHQPHWDGVITTPIGAESVRLHLQLPSGQRLGWRHDAAHDSLVMVADLERLSHDITVQQLLSKLTRAYAARDALKAAQSCPGAVVDQLR
ncbi:MAG: hypothetical protein CBB79_07145 [Synechococcus sp. TMED19]|nr:MAG: hypothetical protein CBB79_07145 [Synechococcus sp. TMED19]